MIKSFNHKGLKIFYESGNTKGIQQKHKQKIRNILAVLDSANKIKDIDFPNFRLHQLKGNQKQIWFVWVSGNWRIVFEFTDGNAYIVNYLDYH